MLRQIEILIEIEILVIIIIISTEERILIVMVIMLQIILQITSTDLLGVVVCLPFLLQVVIIPHSLKIIRIIRVVPPMGGAQVMGGQQMV